MSLFRHSAVNSNNRYKLVKYAFSQQVYEFNPYKTKTVKIFELYI